MTEFGRVTDGMILQAMTHPGWTQRQALREVIRLFAARAGIALTSGELEERVEFLAARVKLPIPDEARE